MIVTPAVSIMSLSKRFGDTVALDRVAVAPPGEADGPAWLECWLGALGVSTDFADYGLGDPHAAIAAVLDSPRGRNFIGATDRVEHPGHLNGATP